MEKYENMVVIGQGQYGTAFRARDKYDGNLYCVKRIPMSAKDDHAGALREAQLLDSLDHPNIIRYRESFVDKEGSLCIVTSFCEEGDLFTLIRKKAAQKEYFTEEEVMDIFVQTADAVSFIHSKRVLHRDLKTQNIFIARGGIIKLGDFGISKVLERTDSFATTVTGTPYYMAPEICTNQPYTYKSDIWSLGCVLYELCTLKHAFAADSLLSLVYQIVRGNFPPIPTEQFSNGLSDLVTRLLSRDAATRPSLGEVFKFPYVVQSLARFKAREQRRNLKQSTSISRRKQLLEHPGVGGHMEGSDAALTPKQKMERKKEADRQKRELELKVAAISVDRNREQVAARKKEMLHGSNVGLPGSSRQAPQAPQHAGFEDDDLPNMGTVGTMGGGGRMAAEESSRGAAARSSNKGIWDMDAPGPGPGAAATPYGATLPSQNRQQQQYPQQHAQQQPHAGGAQRPHSATRGGHGAGSSRPGTAPQRPASGLLTSRGVQLNMSNGTGKGGGRGGGMWDADDDDDVLAGSVRPGTRGGGTVRAGLQATASSAEQAGGRTQQWPSPGWEHGGMSGGMGADDMPNMGTVQMSRGPAPIGAGNTRGSPAARPMDYSVANRTGASDSPLMGSVNLGTMGNTRTGGGMAAVGTSARAMDDRPLPPYNGGAALASGPEVRRSAAGVGGRGAGVGERNSPQAQRHSPRGYNGDDDDGGYSDDFEDDDDEAGEDVVRQRNRIIANVDDISSRAYDGRDSVAAVQDSVIPSGGKADKARALRAKGVAELGQPLFKSVYDYLSRARRLNTDEKEVQRRLQEMVAGTKVPVIACFSVDQLVFLESMYQ
ncbi:Serine/threonine-protein kinase Nek4 [Tetrabaena socialis]|uniref:non-specific serine/threonine protein kinase n=1 Tax=Tetrabaena socialis TaxID=47790 RepID=A0A2J7ZR68_9CHLO|nr:Serine/threonine-protein kinase Nek4 [Tetrabaena socialis]|eukprot:PNH02758.1 Serine/threonine-protein kinase Nek4 [Tetrabaena socialis]